jgi:acetyl-CoA C-acetyltransferase
MESMTNAPYLLPKARSGFRIGNVEAVDAMIHDGLWCAFDKWHMGETGEVVAREFGVSREAQDSFAARSNEKAIAAIEAGKLLMITPVEIQQAGAPSDLQDEGPRAD